MSQPRANFLLAVHDNQIYVYGGIQGAQSANGNQHHPFLCSAVCEKYDPKTNTWTTVEIKGAEPLASFGWTCIGEARYLLFGGTDGNVLQNTTYIVDFKTLTCDLQKVDSDVGLA